MHPERTGSLAKQQGETYENLRLSDASAVMKRTAAEISEAIAESLKGLSLSEAVRGHIASCVSSLAA